ncbi:MAG: sigma-70 family RNA polymerase sigma factor [Firmicutes bacterium]|jgi:RNA polymerase sigma-70 factor (ECF subfamily)|uniref:RNA polymerase subunit sigma-24 n=1 Tax=Sulfobacillus benefaciens TaxID=453960 RepID=A0A2T2WV80_9FIRM|nr:sigma-70 family RNA polymerase sigma factor [Bacillota bacterium]MCL5014867.1 sigma-70 family RNA polymerase sigma factor [Bacillota bacterium]PSR26157.1 MAG: RNA polymerase subunit sigma-24 [Sulfobacillus benefaciens]HBQ95534.1 RNA polymerase subunit sigma-24 [Sulfobacillus sp.]
MPFTNALDERHFTEFMEDYGDKALRYAFVTLHVRGDAEDVTQEAFVRLWRHAMRRGMDNVTPALLFHTLTNLCRDKMRYYKRHPEDPTDILESTHPSAVDEIPLLIDDMNVLQAVMQLGVAERQCILLFYYMDRSLKETATALGVSEQVVKTRLYRARQHLRPLLEPTWKEGLQ